MDRALVNAEKRRDEIAAEINKTNQYLEDLRKDLSTVENFIADWHRYADVAEDSESKEPAKVSSANESYPQGSISHDTGESPKSSTLKNPDKAEVRKTAKAIIYEKRRPVPRTELFKELAARGLLIHGKDPEMVLSTMMWRMQEEFVRLPGHGYWLKSLRWPAAKYEPGDAPQTDIEDIAIQLEAALNKEE